MFNEDNAKREDFNFNVNNKNDNGFVSFTVVSLLASMLASRNIISLLVLEAAGKKIMEFQSFFFSSLNNTQQFLTKKACLPCVTIHSFVFISTIFFLLILCSMTNSFGKDKIN